MDHEIIEEILSCTSLPSLPAVALRVVELTSNVNVKLPELATTIQNDQGLASKVLRTVNSSFYGLPNRCASINKALVLLGLGPVKSLALSFSLIGSLGDQDDGFDYQTYWRRGLYTAVSAKVIADHLKLAIADEAFLAGLLQDIGVIAMHRALGFRYAEVLEAAGGDHRQLVKCELSAFEVQHPEIGAMLAQRWKFPDELIMPVRYHERPTAAPQGHHEIVRLIGLGNLAHDAMTDSDPGPALRKLYQRTDQWFGIKSDAMQGIVKKIAEGAKDMSSLLRLETGAHPDAESIVREAEKQLMDMASATTSAGGAPTQTLDNLLIDSKQFDPLTGAVGRAGFDLALKKAFELSTSTQEPVALVQVALDGLQHAAGKIGTSAGDQTVNACIVLLKKHFASLGGVICKLGGDLFAVVLYGANGRSAQRCAEEFRNSFDKATMTWPIGGGSVKSSIGVASHEPGTPATHPGLQQLVIASVNALKAARAAGHPAAAGGMERAAA
ncbi:MAG: HDOD domain-containing protein [Phycisphaeraceae bacterium]|nr:HDOD domain-containing protein [Phycisphaeraceae bacterium]